MQLFGSLSSFSETFTMIARGINSISYANSQGFGITSSLPFRVVWDVSNNIYTDYPSGISFITHIYSTNYSGNILIQSSDLTSITVLSPHNSVAPQMTSNSVRYLEIETSQLKNLDGLLIYGNGGLATYFTSGDISLLPSTLTDFHSQYSNCSGDVGNLPSNLKTLFVDYYGNSQNQSNNIFGNVSNLPTTLMNIILCGKNVLSSNISDFPPLF